MFILGIESSCDETAASLIEVSGRKLNPHIRVLSNIVSSQVKIHARYGGVVPEVAARKHAEIITQTISKALKAKSYKLKAIDVVATTSGPGLITSLRVGVDAAKTLAYILKKPLIPVNHIEGHIYSNWLQPVRVRKDAEFHAEKRGIKFPALVLVVSGGHTELVLMKDHGKYKIIGQTLDDAVGEAFDKVAKILGLGYPGGPVVAAKADSYVIARRSPRFARDRLRNLYNDCRGPMTIGPRNLRDRRCPIGIGLCDDLVRFPRPMLNSSDYNFSFAGLKTAVLYKFRELEKSYPNPHHTKCCGRNISCDEQKVRTLDAVLAYEFQNAAVEVLVAKTERAAREFKAKTVMLAGGVSANRKLRADLEKAISEIGGIQYVQPSLEYTTDNAAMIAVAGYFNYTRNPQKFREGWRRVKVNPNLSL